MSRAASSLQVTPADKMNNFDAVAVVDCRLVPLVAAHDALVHLNGNALRRQAQFANQLGKHDLMVT